VIDFRYHLVSIVSIFMALAVGIVLGAGPLQGRIGDTLTSEITQLRSDKAALRDQVTTLERGATEADAYAEATLGRVVSGVASGRGVALVVLPDVNADRVVEVADVVTRAGATVASTTRVQPAFVATDTDTRTARDALAERLAGTLRMPVTTGAGSAPLIDRVLAAALAADTTTGVGQEAARSALTELVTAKLVEVDPKTAVPAQLVVVLGNPLTSGTAKERSATATAWSQLAVALDAASSGTVLASFLPTPAGDGATSLVGAIRQDSNAAKAVATVDDAAEPMGLASVVLALVEQESGTVGHYGTGEGATAPFAPLPVAP
jgi:VIT1/CCC1 family predicted Fe2+/Mn2+ transporter